MTVGRSLELFYLDGTPDGMMTAEVFGWTGHVLRVPRTLAKEALARPEARHTGVYFLLGERDGEPLAYIGEAESVARRIRQYAAERDWWTDAYVVTTSADALHKAHARYLEARLIAKARDAAASLENGYAPEPTSLNEAARANMESFLDTLLMILPAMGVSLFQTGKRPAARPEDAAAEAAHTFRLETPRNGVRGEAILDGADFVVRAGSVARGEWHGSVPGTVGYGALHGRLLAEGVLVPDGTGTAAFAEDYAFGSPSAAGAILNGRSCNGRLEWRRADDGRSYGEWERDQLEDDPVETA